MADNIFVSRDNNTYQIDMASSGSLKDTDFVIVNRDGVLYKATGDRFGKPPAAPEITQVILQQNQTNENRYTSNSFTSIVASNEENPTATTLMTAEVEGALSIEAATEPIATNTYSASTETVVPLTLDGTFNLGDVFEVDDVVLANEGYTPQTDQIDNTSLIKTWNQDQEWSTYITWDSFEGSFVKVFDAGKAYPDGMITGANKKLVKMSGFFVPVTSVVTLTCRTTDRYTADSTTKVIVNVAGQNVTYANTSGAPTREEDGIGYWDIPVGAGTLLEVHVQGNSNVGRTYLGGIEVDGIKLVDAGIEGDPGSGYELTLSSEKDIELFQAGDAVQSPSSGYNRDRNWSESVTTSSTFNSSYLPINGFDLDTTNQCSNVAKTNGQSSVTISFDPPITVNEKIEIVGGVGSGDAARTTIDGVSTNAVTLTTNNVGSENYQTLYTGSGQLSEIFVYDTVVATNQNQCGFSSIKIDGKRLIDRDIEIPGTAKVVSTNVSAKTITVDGGDWGGSDGSGVQRWNQTQTWSGSFNSPSGYAGGSATSLFDGDLSTSVAIGQGGTTGSWDATLTTNLPCTSLQVYCSNKQVNSTGSASANGGTATSITGVGWFDVEPPASGTLTSLVLNRTATTGSNNGLWYAAVRVNNELLVDLGTAGAPFFETKVSTLSPKRGEGTIKTINGTAVTIEPFVDNCFKEDQFLVFKTPKVIEVTPLTDPISDFDSTTNTLTLTGGKDLNQLANGDSVYMTDDSTNPSTQTSYKLTTSAITKVEDTSFTLTATAQAAGGGVWGGNPGMAIGAGSYNAKTVRIDLSQSVSGYFGHNSSGGLGNNTITITYYDASNQTIGSPFVFTNTTSIVRYDDPVERQNVKYFVGTSTATGNGSDGNGWTGHWYDDKQILATGQTYAETVLTFGTPNSDLAYFRNGDVVQSETISIPAKTWSASTTNGGRADYPPANAFDGNTGTFCASPSGGSIVFTVPGDVTLSGKLEVYGNNGSGGAGTNQLTVASDENSITNVNLPATSWYDCGEQTDIKSITVNSTTGGGATLYAIRINGLVLTDGVEQSDTVNSTINDINESSQTITLGGDGKWYADPATGGDGSGTVGGSSKVEYQTNGGQGTVDTVNTTNNSIVIVPTGDRDNRWIEANQAGTEFRVGSPSKPAISQTAYLKFTGAGVVESISAAPVAPQSMSSRNPTLIFPAEFDTNTTPDAELPNPTSLKTTISRTNELGSASASSNVLFPVTSTRSALSAGAAATYTTDGYAEFVCMALSHQGRAAEQRAIQYAENCQALRDAAEQVAEDYIDDNP